MLEAGVDQAEGVDHRTHIAAGIGDHHKIIAIHMLNRRAGMGQRPQWQRPAVSEVQDDRDNGLTVNLKTQRQYLLHIYIPVVPRPATPEIPADDRPFGVIKFDPHPLSHRVPTRYIPQNKMYPQSARGASAAHAPTETASSVPHRIAVDRSAAHASPTGFPAFPSQNAYKTQADSRLSTGSPCPRLPAV